MEDATWAHEDAAKTTVEVGYYVRSSVLGGAVVSELNSAGGQVKSLVYAGGGVITELQPNWAVWRNDEPVTGTRGYSGRAGDFQLAEERYDAEGVNVGSYDPFIVLAPPVPDDAGGAWLLGGAGLPSGRCSVDGMRVDCEQAGLMMESDTAVQCPNNDCGPRRVNYQERPTWAFFNAYGDGYQGYVPATAHYVGAGIVRESTLVTRYVDEVDPNRSYTFQYTDPETGETSAETAYGSVVSTDRSSWTLDHVNPDQTYVTFRRLSSTELAPRMAEIAKALTPGCVAFVNKLVNTATGKNYDAEKQLLGDLTKIADSRKAWDSGIFYKSDVHNYGASAMKGGSFAAGTVGIYLGDPYTPSQSTLPYNVTRNASDIFAELMHAVADVDDFDGSRALAKMGVTPIGADGLLLPYPQEPRPNNPPYSLYFHTGVDNACKTKP